MGHVMVDIETLGSCPGSVMLSIGAVRLTEISHQEFYRVIDFASCSQYAMRVDPQTLSWWLRQLNNSILLDIGEKGAASLLQAMADFCMFTSRDDTVWAFPTSFDLSHIHWALDVLKLPIAWSQRNERDLRTLMYHIYGEDRDAWPTFRQKGWTPRFHHALDDARVQMGQLNKILKIRKHYHIPT